ncbi:MAG TPA: ATP-dependent sacrificial sulfur transferase LarE [Gemmataceae bacterium]|nr:ATP-dependent sacrificial sulfur transferase LarE [Gemmataceae bacterium]
MMNKEIPSQGAGIMEASYTSLTAEQSRKRERLLEILRGLKSVAVAFSGGIDSTVVAKAAHLALGDRAVAVTADSASVPRSELEDARRLAQQIGIRQQIIVTDEFNNDNYVRNDGTRCYFCKTELYDQIQSLLPKLGVAVICSGANLDDQGDYRPGLKAAAEHAVRHPLQEAGCTKADVRALARNWDLSTWDKPASPCLSSRLAPGVEVTPERTSRVEAAEAYLKTLGYRECRVRLHEAELARIEVPAAELARLVDPPVRAELVSRMKELGFQYITLDLEGFRSGSLNALVGVETKRLFAHEDPSRDRPEQAT